MLGSISQNAQQLWVPATPQVTSCGVIGGVLCACQQGCCACARVRVCIHALTWVTAQLRCLTWSSPSSDCIVHLDLNFILVKKEVKRKKKQKSKVAGSTGWSAFLWKNVCSDGPWDVSTDFIWDFVWKESRLLVGQMSTRKRGRAKMLACPLPPHIRVLCVLSG